MHVPSAFQIIPLRVVDYHECIHQKELALTGGIGGKTGSFPGYAIPIIVLSLSLCVLFVLLALECRHRHGNRHRNGLDLQAECYTQPGGSPTLGNNRGDQRNHTNSRSLNTPELTCMYHKTANGTMVRKKGKVNTDQQRCFINENKSMFKNSGDSRTAYSDDCEEAREATSTTQGIQKDRQMSAEELVRNPNLLTEGQKNRQLHHLESIRDPNVSEEWRDTHVHVHMHPLDSIRNPSLLTMLTEEQNVRHIPPLEIARYHSLPPKTTKEHKNRQLSPPEFARDPTSTLLSEDEKDRLIPSLEFATDLSLPDSEGQKERQVPPLAFATDRTCILLTKGQKHRQVASPRFDMDTGLHVSSSADHLRSTDASSSLDPLSLRSDYVAADPNVPEQGQGSYETHFQTYKLFALCRPYNYISGSLFMFLLNFFI